MKRIPSSLLATCASVLLATLGGAQAQWIQKTKIVPPGGYGSTNSYFGKAVAVYHDWALVGAPDLDGLPGEAFLYEEVNGGWRPRETFRAPSPIPDEDFGRAVGLASHKALVGAPGDGSTPGRVYVFEAVGRKGTWAPTGVLQGLDPRDGDGFGSSIAFVGNVAVIGAPGRDVAEVFEYRRGVWLRIGRLKPSRYTRDFGEAVAYDGTSIFVGAPRDEWVFVYTRNSSRRPVVQVAGGAAAPKVPSWREVQVLHPVGGHDEDFGAAIAVDGERAVIGAPDDEREGTAFVFERLGETAWQQTAILQPESIASRAEFGTSVALAGDRLVVGAPSFDQEFGSVHVFEQKSGGWNQTQELTASVAAVAGQGQFGTYVAMYGSQVLTSIGIDDALPFGVYVGSVLVWQPSSRPALTITSSTPGIPYVDRDNTATATPNQMSTSLGGGFTFQLDAGEAWAFQPYQLLGSLSGKRPGTHIGALELPLNPDAYFSSTLFFPTHTPIGQPVGYLDADGRAEVTFSVPPGALTGLAGASMHHAFAVFPRERLTGFASNAVSLKLVP